MSLLNEDKINTTHLDLSKSYKKDANKLITSNRIDIVAKSLFLKFPKISFYKKLYLDSIYYLNGGVEDSGKDKNNTNHFLTDFIKNFNKIKSEGFSKNISIIPISKESLIPLDGAHRIAIGDNIKSEVDVIEVDEIADIYNYNYFRTKGMPEVDLDHLLEQYIESFGKNIFCGILWGKARGSLSKVKKIISQYSGIHITQKEITLSNNGKRNLIINCYNSEKWIGNIKNNFIGADKKVSMCFDKNDSSIRVLFFEFNKQPSSEQLIRMKDDIRKIFNIGKNSIHITDNITETRELSNIFLNKNSIHYLNNMRYRNYSNFLKLLQDYTNNILNKKDFYCLTGSGVLSLYGIREGSDLDYITTDKKDIAGSHNPYIKEYLHSEIEEIIFNPKNHFKLSNGIKVLSLYNIKIFKENRSEGKDINDLKMIESYIQNVGTGRFSLRLMILNIKQKVLYKTLNILIRIGVKIIPKRFLPFFKKIYYKIIG